MVIKIRINRAANILSVCNLALLYIINDPSPVLPPIHSPTTAPIGAKHAATLSPEHNPGKEEGILIFQNNWIFERFNVFPASISSWGTLFKASVKLDVIGKKTIKTPITILLIIPYPSHKINNGAKAKTGIDWLASNIGIIHLFNVSEEEIIKAVDIPIREPIAIEAKISISV